MQSTPYLAGTAAWWEKDRPMVVIWSGTGAMKISGAENISRIGSYGISNPHLKCQVESKKLDST